MSLYSASPLDSRTSAACGKVVLFGEHSILYGGNALSLPLKNLSFKIKFTPSSINTLVIKTKENTSSFKTNAENQFWSLLERDFADISFFGHYEIKSDLPIGAGLGSSAALAVALHRLHRPHLKTPELIQRSWKSEELFHGKSSGMDPTTIATEKALCFFNPTHYEILNDKLLLDENYVFVLKDSGIRRSTQSGIQASNVLKENNPSKWETIQLKLQELSLASRALFENADAIELGNAMNQAHELLSERGVSHPSLEEARQELLESGALGVKLTGAGSGGFLISLYDRSTWSALKARNEARRASTLLELSFG